MIVLRCLFVVIPKSKSNPHYQFALCISIFFRLFSQNFLPIQEKEKQESNSSLSHPVVATSIFSANLTSLLCSSQFAVQFSPYETSNRRTIKTLKNFYSFLKIFFFTNYFSSSSHYVNLSHFIISFLLLHISYSLFCRCHFLS